MFKYYLDELRLQRIKRSWYCNSVATDMDEFAYELIHNAIRPNAAQQTVSVF
jgi:hypothetical protein